MKLKTLMLMVALLASVWASAQDAQKYKLLKDEAVNLTNQKLYLEAAQKYNEAFIALGNKGHADDRYNAACAWALAGQADSAFKQLFIIAEKTNYKDYNHIIVDHDLVSLANHSKWKALMAVIKANKDQSEIGMDKEIIAVLDTVYQTDQVHRGQIAPLSAKGGMESDEMKALLKKMRRADSINLAKVVKLLDKHGWLGAKTIGDGTYTIFLVIQHAPLAVQQKYLPVMKAAVQKKEIGAGNFATLQDRILVQTKQPQRYGTQIGMDRKTGFRFVFPMEDPDLVDARRAEVGLATLGEYLATFGMSWDLAKYKEQLPALEARIKKGE